MNLEGNKRATNAEKSRIYRYVFVGFNYFLQHSLFGLSAPDGDLHRAEAKVDFLFVHRGVCFKCEDLLVAVLPTYTEPSKASSQLLSHCTGVVR
jgi:hypothetical protein